MHDALQETGLITIALVIGLTILSVAVEEIRIRWNRRQTNKGQ